ncbi:hypothetical protein ACOMHN_065871 [Nucella lapillus]
MAQLDLSLLPDVVLRHLFKVLPVCARGRLAMCCQTLSTVIDFADVWMDITLGLDVNVRRVHNQRLDLHDPGKVMESLQARDQVLIEKYGGYFKNVHVVMSAGHIELESLTELAWLSMKGMVKSLDLRLDKYQSQITKWRRHPQAKIDLINRNLNSDNFFSTVNCSPVKRPDTTAHVMEHLRRPGTSISITLCPRKRGAGHPPVLVQQYVQYADQYVVRDFYCGPKSMECRTLLTRLDLATSTRTEADLARMSRRLTSTPTAQLVACFPGLQELHVNTGNLSEQLLQELSAPGRTAPLRSLHIRKDEGLDMPCSDLPSAAWSGLVNANPSLKVLCVVITYDLPLLSNVIKPETPLVELRVSCMEGERDSLLELYELCTRHSSTLELLSLSLLGNRQVLKENTILDSFEDVVKTCQQLRHLHCAFEIRERFLMDLARDSRQWRTFRFSPPRIIASLAEDSSSGLGLSAEQRQFMSERGLICDQSEDPPESEFASVASKDFMCLVLLLKEY